MGLRRRQHIEARATTTAPPEAVYALLRDGATWPEWSPLGSFQLERPGEQEPEGVGAIRVFRTGRVTGREQIVELVPDRRLSYVLLSGLAIRDYRADVDLEPGGEGTVVHWRAAFLAKVPGSGGAYRRGLARFLQNDGGRPGRAGFGRNDVTDAPAHPANAVRFAQARGSRPGGEPGLVRLPPRERRTR